MADRKLFDELSERELKTLDVLLATSAARTAVTLDGYIEMRLTQGASRQALLADLLNDLETGGRIFGEFRNAVKATSNGTINRFRDVGQFSESGVDKGYRWAAVLVNTCPDCLALHGTLKSWDEWEADGMPRTDHTVCKQHCKCMLVPEDTTVLEPVMRPKRKK